MIHMGIQDDKNLPYTKYIINANRGKETRIMKAFMKLLEELNDS